VGVGAEGAPVIGVAELSYSLSNGHSTPILPSSRSVRTRSGTPPASVRARVRCNEDGLVIPAKILDPTKE
jgi:hypothetical protein